MSFFKLRIKLIKIKGIIVLASLINVRGYLNMDTKADLNATANLTKTVTTIHRRPPIVQFIKKKKNRNLYLEFPFLNGLACSRILLACLRYMDERIDKTV